MSFIKNEQQERDFKSFIKDSPLCKRLLSGEESPVMLTSAQIETLLFTAYSRGNNDGYGRGLKSAALTMDKFNL